MRFGARLNRLEHTRPSNDQAYAGARELLQVRIERADPETQARLLAAISKRIERAAEN